MPVQQPEEGKVVQVVRLFCAFLQAPNRFTARASSKTCDKNCAVLKSSSREAKFDVNA